MRTAMLVYGQMREYDKCIHTIKKNILDVLHPDVFIHTWKNRGHSLYSEVAGINTNFTSDEVNKDDLIHHFNPIKCEIQDYNDWLSSLSGDYKFVMNTEKKSATPKNYKIKLCNKMKREHEDLNGFKYDCVIVFRPDTILFTPIPQYVLDDLSCVWHLNPPHLFNPYICHSMFHVMDSKCADVYETYYDALPELWKLPWIERGFDTKYDCTRTSAIYFRQQGVRLRAYKKYQGFVETYRQPDDFKWETSEIDELNEAVIDSVVNYTNTKNENIISWLKQLKGYNIINTINWCKHWLYIDDLGYNEIITKIT